MALIEKELPTDARAITTMRAAVVHSFTEPLSIDIKPVPAPGHGEILVKIETCGLCHTDIHAAHGDWPVKPAPPFTPGHEGVGIVVALGEAVTEVELGDRVALPWLALACGSCEYCVSGRETLCPHQQMMGYTIDGGMAEFAKAFAEYVVKVPSGISPAEASPLTCAGVTTYKAVKVAGTRSSRPRSRVRHRRPRPPGRAVREDRRRPRDRRRPQ